jgi:hypothetical protein
MARLYTTGIVWPSGHRLPLTSLLVTDSGEVLRDLGTPSIRAVSRRVAAETLAWWHRFALVPKLGDGSRTYVQRREVPGWCRKCGCALAQVPGRPPYCPARRDLCPDGGAPDSPQPGA